MNSEKSVENFRLFDAHTSSALWHRFPFRSLCRHELTLVFAASDDYSEEFSDGSVSRDLDKPLFKVLRRAQSTDSAHPIQLCKTDCIVDHDFWDKFEVDIGFDELRDLRQAAAGEFLFQLSVGRI